MSAQLAINLSILLIQPGNNSRSLGAFALVLVLLAICCDKNVIVPCSERVYSDQNGSGLSSGKRLKNHVE